MRMFPRKLTARRLAFFALSLPLSLSASDSPEAPAPHTDSLDASASVPAAQRAEDQRFIECLLHHQPAAKRESAVRSPTPKETDDSRPIALGFSFSGGGEVLLARLDSDEATIERFPIAASRIWSFTPTDRYVPAEEEVPHAQWAIQDSFDATVELALAAAPASEPASIPAFLDPEDWQDLVLPTPESANASLSSVLPAWTRLAALSPGRGESTGHEAFPLRK